MADEVQDLQLKEITLVQLPPGANAKRQFLMKLQNELAPEGTLSALTPGPSADVFVVPHAAEQAVREKLGIPSTAQWVQCLKDWNAQTVNLLQLDAYIALETRGSTVYKGELISQPKVSAPHPQAQAKSADVGQVQPQFAGPYDWHIDERGVNAAKAWRMFVTEKGATDRLPWADVRIAHIDTGYTEHAALGWNQGSSSFVFPDQGKDLWQGDDALDGPRDPFLPGFPGHGTRISAAIAGFYPTAAGGPFYGVAPGAKIIPYRVTDSVIVDHVQDHVREAIRAAIRAKCHVVNISLGALRPSKFLSEAVDEAYEAGLIVVCAAGQVWGEVIYPGRFNRCVTLGGVGPGLKPWRSAATGIYVDLCGPADEIRRVKAQDLAPGKTATGIAPKTGDGTSYATACCTGAAALWLAWHGLDTLKEIYGPTGIWQIPKAFKYLVMTTAKPGDWPAGVTDTYGRGVLDIPALLAAKLPIAGSMRKENLAYGVFDDGSL
jgi:subtilisin family serine protease